MRSSIPVLAAVAMVALPGRAQVSPAPEPAASFAAAARTVTDSIQREYYDQKTGLYARSLSDRGPEFTWGNGVMLSALVAAARHDPAAYRPLVDRFFASMDPYWDAADAVPGYEPAPITGPGHDKYYDDNEWLVIAFVEAYDVTREAKYLDRARQALKFSLSGWDDRLGGGIWWHEGHKGRSKNTCSNAPAAVACVRLARYGDAPENLEWARKLVKWTSGHLEDADGLFFDNQRVDDSRIDRTKYTYNAALMVRANLGLYRATGEPGYLAEAKRIAAACELFVDPKTGAYRGPMRFSHLLVEADLELYRATGDGALLARARRNGEVARARWQHSPPKELIEQAAVARMLWLLADQESSEGRAFWAGVDEAIDGLRRRKGGVR